MTAPSCSDVPSEYLGVGDGCDCPADGSTSCDPDCTTGGNPGGAYCGCQYCYPEEVAPPTGTSCDLVPHEYLGVHDGCDCPGDGDRTCDSDCAEQNFADDYCGCQFCYGSSSSSTTAPPAPDPYAVDLPNRMSLEMVAVLARHSLNVGQNAQVKRGARGFGRVVNTGANGTTTFGSGSKVGETWSACSVQVGSNAQVGGNVYTPGGVTQGTGSTVSGTIEKVPTLPDTRTHTWRPTLPAAGANKSVASGTTTLAPGGYGNVSVTGGTLRLSGGVYRVGDLTVGSGGKLMIDTSAGPVTIYVTGGVQFDGAIVNTAGQPDPKLEVLVVVTGTGTVNLGNYFNGTVYAPRSTVSLTKAGTPGYAGSFYGNDVTLATGVIVSNVAYPWSNVEPDAPKVWGDSAVNLGAWFDYGANQSHPAEQTLATPIYFTIPPVLPVRNGNAGNGTARVKFSLGGGPVTTCTYVGAAGIAHPTTEMQRMKGLIYDFQSCSDGSVAGQRVHVDWISLEVVSGDASDPSKTAEVALDSGEGCSAYIPPPLHPWEVVDLKSKFTWRSTKALAETDPDGHPALWHGLIYIENKDQLAGLDRLRVMWSPRPLSATYTEQMRGLCGRLEHAADSGGVVVYAIFPAKLFNTLRLISQKAELENIAPPFRFIIPSSPDPEYTNSDGSLRYDALSGTGYKEWLAARSTLSPGFWSKLTKPFVHAGMWVANNIISPVTNVTQNVFHYTIGSFGQMIDTLVPLFDDLWELAQQGLGALATSVETTVDLHLDVRLQNLDPSFPANSWLVRAWGPACTPATSGPSVCAGEQPTTGTRPILLPTGTKFRIRQWGFGFLPIMAEKTLGSSGRVDLQAIKNRTGRGGDFCIQLDANYAAISTDIIPNEVCDFATNRYGNFEHPVPSTQYPDTTFLIANDDLHTMAQLKDGFDYNHTVLHRDSYAVDVLTGWTANAMTSVVNIPDLKPRAMTLCLDFPSMGSSLVTLLGSALTLGIADKIYNKDMWWPDAASTRGARRSRVMTHEYGHFTMCDLLYGQNGPAGLNGLLGRVFHPDETTRSGEPALMTETMAEVYALQVAGGTNYLASDKSTQGWMSYCTGSKCFDYNYQGTNDSQQRGNPPKPNDGFHDELARWVSLAYDAFDQVGGSSRLSTTAVSNSDYWTGTYGSLVYGAASYLGTDDEPVTLGPRDWQTWMNDWQARGATPNVGNTMGGLFDAVRAHHNWCNACELMATHHPAASTSLTMAARTPAVELQRYEFCVNHPELFGIIGKPPRTDGRFDLACTACPASQYVDNTTGSATFGQCKACPTGSIAGLHNCTACPPGTVPSANNDCRACGANQISSGGSCVTCPFGQAADVATNTCVFCESDAVIDWAGTGLCGQTQVLNVPINGASGDHCPNDGWLEVRNISSGPYGSAFNTFQAQNLFSPDISSQSQCQSSTASIRITHKSGSSLITDLTQSGTGAYQGACDVFVCPPVFCALPTVPSLTRSQVQTDGNTLRILASALRSGAPIGTAVKLTLTPTTPNTTCGPR